MPFEIIGQSRIQNCGWFGLLGEQLPITGTTRLVEVPSSEAFPSGDKPAKWDSQNQSTSAPNF